MARKRPPKRTDETPSLSEPPSSESAFSELFSADLGTEFQEGVPLSERISSPPHRTSSRFIMTTRELGLQASKALRKSVENIAGKRDIVDAAALLTKGNAPPANATVDLEELGIMIVDGDPDQLAAVSKAAGAVNRDLPYIVEPEALTYLAASVDAALSDWQTQQLRAYQAGMNAAIESLLQGGGANEWSLATPVTGSASAAPLAEPALLGIATASVEPGLAMVAADQSPFTGEGVRVAVLDTGLDFSHPDFASRVPTDRWASFVRGETPQDANGHGTHCAGIACGPLQPANGSRYGVASDAELFIGKVINRTGRGGLQGDLLSGMYWALRNQCRVISVSIEFNPAAGYSASMERVGAIALSSGGMIVAAVGNGSDRAASPPIYAPVAAPANCPSILGVGAVNSTGQIARFSNRAKFHGGGVNFVALGVDVLSSYVPRAGRRYATDSGTSMSTPFVAGIAALYLQRSPQLTGPELYDSLRRGARQLTGPSEDYGWGLVQAPR